MVARYIGVIYLDSVLLVLLPASGGVKGERLEVSSTVPCGTGEAEVFKV